MLPGLPKKGEDQVGPGIYSYKRNLRTFTASFKEQLILIDEKIGEKKNKKTKQTDGWMDGWWSAIQKGRSRFGSRSPEARNCLHIFLKHQVGANLESFGSSVCASSFLENCRLPVGTANWNEMMIMGRITWGACSRFFFPFSPPAFSVIFTLKYFSLGSVRKMPQTAGIKPMAREIGGAAALTLFQDFFVFFFFMYTYINNKRNICLSCWGDLIYYWVTIHMPLLIFFNSWTSQRVWDTINFEINWISQF